MNVTPEMNVADQAVLGRAGPRLTMACEPARPQMRVGSPTDNRVMVRLSAAGTDSVPEDCLLTIDVTALDDPAEPPLFSRAPAVQCGTAIGEPQAAQIRVLPDAGTVDLEFFPQRSGDGQLTVSHRLCESIKVSFHVDGD
jgi:hypothetical protein